MKLNLTPVIDVVFQLIIFLIIVYQRIDAENFQLDVPQHCTYAINNKNEITPATVSVFPNYLNGKPTFAVGTETCPFQSSADITNWLVFHINKETTEKKLKTLRLRIDKQ